MSETASLLVDRYELGKVIGRGGMAEVHLGRDLRLGRTVAIKILRADLARDPAFQARFRREAQSAASLNHPAIVAVYDTGEEVINGLPVPFIVMEYVEGSTLRDLLSSGKRLLPVRAMEVTASVLTALEYSHRQGIVHRDIKPGNVMLTTDGRVKVMDFGIARALADTGAMTQTAAVMGTAQYLSPEQAKGEQVDTRSDLYSTGCLLYELLTGQPPFSGESPVSVAYQHVREEAPAPSQIDPEVPRSADAVTMKALTKDRNHRYQNAAEFRADLEHVIRGNDPVTALLPPINAPLGGPAAAPTTALPAYGMAASGVGTGPNQPLAGGYPGGSVGDQRKNGMGGVLLAALAAIAILALVIFMITKGNNTAEPTPTNTGATSAQAQLPSVVGQTEAQARSLLKEWKKIDSKTEDSNQYAKGIVIKQNPDAGTLGDKNTMLITLTVSSGPPQDNLKDLTGQTRNEAVAYLNSKKLTAQFLSEDSPKKKDTVIRTSPEAGTSIQPGQEVTVYVSSGKYTLPDVKTQGREAAIQTLAQAGFTSISVTVSTQTTTDPAQNDVVVDMSPTAGQVLDLSTTIALVVQKYQGAGPSTTPTTSPGTSSSSSSTPPNTTSSTTSPIMP